MKHVTTSAPGKLMFMGEHAVVYGYPCLVTAVDKRLYVEVELIDKNDDEFITPGVKESRFVLESLAYIRKKFHIQKRVRIKTRGDFSHQVGLGSSSAVTVATFKALSSLFQIKISNNDLFQMSYEVTLAIQGVGSGFDIAAATYGGTLFFVKGGKVITEVASEALPLVVGYSGIKADTPFYIRKVAEAFRDRRVEMNLIFSSIEKLVLYARKAIEEKKYLEVGASMNENQKLLQKLGVSTKKLDAMINASNVAGAYGAKLSGAGGGDCMIALIPEEKRSKIERAIERVGGEVIRVHNSVGGVVVE